MSRIKDRLESIRAKIERAEQLLSEIRELDRAYRPIECSLSIQENPASGIGHFSFDIPGPPTLVSILVGDCVNNLRSSLDHLIWQIVDSNNIAQASHSNMFPICSAEDAFAKQIKTNRLRGVPEEALDQIRRFQPYASENNHLLSLLSTLSNEDKHRDLIYSIAIASDIELSFYRNGVNLCNLVVGNDEFRNGEIFGGIGFDLSLLAGKEARILGRANACISFRDSRSESIDALSIADTLDGMKEFVKYEVIESLWDYVLQESS
ncbi:hypothetical protein A1353_20580 [Methylomonas methanica]|uniref:Uncharacterized protein n=1 Tax=Methylomonas methanica TaxID=421 RepID=A0A177M1I1_METMH|nr:hypothetical protein [Methylomonas methanica]OAH99500.1 hypothetical protein A1353_20580 [Methylomonas methanica]